MLRKFTRRYRIHQTATESASPKIASSGFDFAKDKNGVNPLISGGLRKALALFGGNRGFPPLLPKLTADYK